jgi:hypothetical protein
MRSYPPRETSAELPSVSVVIPTYNRRSMLAGTLRPLLADPDALEIIVVVDGSQDGTLEDLEAIADQDPRLRPIWIENSGHRAARMVGARAARGEVVLLLDDDVVVEPGIVAGHARHHSAATGLVVLGTMPVCGGDQQNADDYPRVIYAQEYLNRTRRWLEDPASVLSPLWEGHLSVRRADLLALEDLLALDAAAHEKLGGYFSDWDFGLRLASAGLRGVFDPELRGVHLYTRTPEAFLRDARGAGHTIARLRQLHPDQAATLERGASRGGRAGAVQALITRIHDARWPVGILFGAGVVLSVAVKALGWLCLYRAQRIAARLRFWVEQQRGTREAERCHGA